MDSKNRSEAGFTVIELLVVIAIVAVLAALLLPTLNKAKKKAHLTKCSSNLRQLGMAMRMYSDENNDDYPVVTWDTQFKQYTYLKAYLANNLEVFHCPGAYGKCPKGPLDIADPVHKLSQPYYAIATNQDRRVWYSHFKVSDSGNRYTTNELGVSVGSKYRTYHFNPSEFIVIIENLDPYPRHHNNTDVNAIFLDNHVAQLRSNIDSFKMSDLSGDRKMQGTFTSDSNGSFPWWNWGFPEKTYNLPTWLQVNK